MAETPIHMIHGPAGTGKTYLIKEKLKKDPGFAKLCATTGIAAVNLGDGVVGEGVTTLNSALAYFDSTSLRENLENGKLARMLKSLLGVKKYIVVDEASMLDALSFDCLVQGLDDVNAGVHEDFGEVPLGLILVGDFLQLPPVEGEYCFISANWERVKVKHLTEIKRQNDPRFQEMLGFARKGDGDTVAKLLAEYGCLVPTALPQQDTTTIFAINVDVDDWNLGRFKTLLATKPVKGDIGAVQWGKKKGEWKLIPQILNLAVGAYVMILSNDLTEEGYANGDCGTVTAIDVAKKVVWVKLKRGGKVVRVRVVCRQCTQRETPQGFEIPSVLTKKQYIQFESKRMEAEGEDVAGVGDWKELYEGYLWECTIKNRAARQKLNDPFYDHCDKRWVSGEVVYMPLRLAYASTVHKIQGLTVDSVQVVIGQHNSKGEKFFRSPNMFYVALSRARTLEGLRVVGTKQQVAQVCNTSRRLLEWI